MKIYNIRDLKAESYTSFLPAPNTVVALRNLELALRNDKVMSEYPAHFELHEVGEADPVLPISEWFFHKQPVVICNLTAIFGANSDGTDESATAGFEYPNGGSGEPTAAV